MPSNQCTNSLMELSFAVGNMLGSESCDRGDYVQLGNILDAYDCSKRGDAGKKLSQIKEKVNDALTDRQCTASGCPDFHCEQVWTAHNELVNAFNLFEEEHLGRGIRGPVPPIVKGPTGASRNSTLAQMRPGGETPWPSFPEEKSDTPASQAARHSVGRHNHDKGRRRRWYPNKSVI